MPASTHIGERSSGHSLCSLTRRLFSNVASTKARTFGQKRTPASTAYCTRTASAAARDTASPSGIGTRRFALEDRRWSCRNLMPAKASIRLRTPIASSNSRPLALQHAPQIFWRGNRFRSTSSTRAPLRASNRAATAPAGPAPITTASHCGHSGSLILDLNTGLGFPPLQQISLWPMPRYRGLNQPSPQCQSESLRRGESSLH
jgi:hypothetical protein